MPDEITVLLRDRWAAKSMTLRRWIVKDSFRNGDPLCELETDGVASTLHAEIHLDDVAWLDWYFVAEGSEVGPGGALLRYGLISHRDFDAEHLHPTARTPLIRRKEYPRFFLSYRREDSEAYAWRLHESFSGSWGTVDVFMDQFSIEPGEAFAWTIQQAVVHAKAVFVLIGPKWLEAVDAKGMRRLDQERDIVRCEITAALDRGTLVVPILLPGGSIPDRGDLPEGMESLPELQFLELTMRHWQADVQGLKDYLERYFKEVLKDHIS